MIGKRFKSNLCGWFTVIEKIPHPKGARWKVEFDEVNNIKYQTITEKKHILSGGIKNPYYPLKLGIACIGDVNSKDYPKEFNKWRAMIERCYDKNNTHYSTYGARGVKVCDRWLCFENFLEDLPNLKGYNYEKVKSGELQLDKDIVGNGKLYSPKNCILVSANENIKEMNKRVNQKDLVAINIDNGDKIISNSQSELSKIIGVNQSSVSRCLNGEIKEVRGYTIKLLEELIND